MFFKLIVVYRVSANSLFTLNGNEGLLILFQFMQHQKNKKEQNVQSIQFFSEKEKKHNLALVNRHREVSVSTPPHFLLFFCIVLVHNLSFF